MRVQPVRTPTCKDPNLPSRGRHRSALVRVRGAAQVAVAVAVVPWVPFERVLLSCAQARQCSGPPRHRGRAWSCSGVRACSWRARACGMVGRAGGGVNRARLHCLSGTLRKNASMFRVRALSRKMDPEIRRVPTRYSVWSWPKSKPRPKPGPRPKPKPGPRARAPRGTNPDTDPRVPCAPPAAGRLAARERATRARW